MTGSNAGNVSRRLYQSLIVPRQREQHLRNREVVFAMTLAGTAIVSVALLLLLLTSWLMLHHMYVFNRVVTCGVACAYLLGIFLLYRRYHYRLSAYLLVLFYTVLAVGIVTQWGINTPFGILLFGLIIILASTLLDSSHALYAAGVSAVTVLLVQIGKSGGHLHPDESWTGRASSLGDALGYCVMFTFLALISWLFGRQMERSLLRAQSAESALMREKALLEIRVKERTAELRNAQLEEMQQLYHFAEIGQISTALLHDLANHLTVLTMEIEGLQSKKHAAAIERSQRIITHLDTMVDSVRRRLKDGPNAAGRYNLVATIDEIIEFMRYKAVNNHAVIDWLRPDNPKAYEYRGDAVRFGQILTILVSNAIDAYAAPGTKRKDALIVVRLERKDDQLVLRITDWGVGIPSAKRNELFKPQDSRKRGGKGIGLYLAKQMVERHFAGSLRLMPDTDRTEFVLTLPEKQL